MQDFQLFCTYHLQQKAKNRNSMIVLTFGKILCNIIQFFISVAHIVTKRRAHIGLELLL